MKKTQNNFWFTLVELIVVITILAILWTIAFISLQWYSAQARDSKRVSDIQNIKKSLELFSLNTWKYPEPDSYFTVKYWSQDLRYQWTVWDQVSTNLSKNLNEKPTDPLTGSEYTYSRTYGWTEYEVLSIYESDLISFLAPSLRLKGRLGWVNESYSSNLNYPKINWNYNGVYVKAGSYYIPTPSIINGNIWWNIDLAVDTTALESQIITGWDNIPLTSTWWLDWMSVEIFSWILDTTKWRDEWGNKELLAQALIDAYSWTILASDWVYKEIVETSSEDYVSLVDDFVLNNDNFVNSSSSEWWDTLTWWRALDSNCDIDDIVIWDQIWAWCNSTLWTWIEWWKKDDWSDWTIWYCYNYDWTRNENDSDCAIWNSNMTSNISAKNFFDLKQVDWYNQYDDVEYDTIWWKLYSWTSLDTNDDNKIDWDDTNFVCWEWYHIPTDEEWSTLEQFLWCDSWEATRTDWWCDWLWWSSSNGTKSRSLANALKLPLSAYRTIDHFTFYYRGYSTFLWSSTASGTSAYLRTLYWNNSTVRRNTLSQNYGFSVRCIKD